MSNEEPPSTQAEPTTQEQQEQHAPRDEAVDAPATLLFADAKYLVKIKSPASSEDDGISREYSPHVATLCGPASTSAVVTPEFYKTMKSTPWDAPEDHFDTKHGGNWAFGSIPFRQLWAALAVFDKRNDGSAPKNAKKVEVGYIYFLRVRHLVGDRYEEDWVILPYWICKKLWVKIEKQAVKEEAAKGSTDLREHLFYSREPFSNITNYDFHHKSQVDPSKTLPSYIWKCSPDQPAPPPKGKAGRKKKQASTEGADPARAEDTDKENSPADGVPVSQEGADVDETGKDANQDDNQGEAIENGGDDVRVGAGNSDPDDVNPAESQVPTEHRDVGDDDEGADDNADENTTEQPEAMQEETIEPVTEATAQEQVASQAAAEEAPLPVASMSSTSSTQPVERPKKKGTITPSAAGRGKGGKKRQNAELVVVEANASDNNRNSVPPNDSMISSETMMVEQPSTSASSSLCNVHKRPASPFTSWNDPAAFRAATESDVFVKRKMRRLEPLQKVAEDALSDLTSSGMTDFTLSITYKDNVLYLIGNKYEKE